MQMVEFSAEKYINNMPIFYCFLTAVIILPMLTTSVCHVSKLPHQLVCVSNTPVVT